MSGATSSLLNFTVPLSDLGVAASGQGVLMPKLSNRFRVLLVGFGTTNNTYELTRQVISCKRPSFKMEETAIDVYNSRIYVAGKPTWNDIDLDLRDDMQGQVSMLVGQQVQKQFDFANQASASSAIDYKFELLYEVLDGGNGTAEPTILETWDLAGCWVSNVDYGSGDYSKSDTMSIKLTIRYDNALQNPAGVGASITRTLGSIAI